MNDSNSSFNKVDSTNVDGLSRPSSNINRPNKKLDSKLYIMIITSSLILLIAFLVTTAVLAKTGVVYFGLKNQADKVQLINPACDNNIIQQYNQIYYQHSSGSRGALDETVQQIKLQNHWQQDPACLYIILQAELMNHNIDQARQLYSDYVKLLQDNHHGYSLALIEGFDGPKSIATFIESVAASPNNSDSDEE